MNKTRLLVMIVGFVLVAILLVVTLGQCEGRPGPETETPGETATATPSADATAQPGTPPPTLTREEEIRQELVNSGGQFTDSVEDCDEILETEDWCSVVVSVERVTFPEWEALLPQTDFFLVKRYARTYEYAEQNNMLIIEQDGQRYAVDTFGRLLRDNGIVVSDRNREQVVKAFVLVTLRNYLEGELVFSDLRDIDVQGGFSFERYNYEINVWTEIQGLNLGYMFMIDQGRLLMVMGWVGDYNTGNYVDVPLESLRPPTYSDLSYNDLEGYQP